MTGRIGEYAASLTAQHFPGERLSPEMQQILSFTMCVDPAKRCTLRELALLIMKHQKRFPPPHHVATHASQAQATASAASAAEALSTEEPSSDEAIDESGDISPPMSDEDLDSPEFDSPGMHLDVGDIEAAELELEDPFDTGASFDDLDISAEEDFS